MRKSNLDEKMVQVCLVGLERRSAPGNAARHHPKCIEHRNGQHCQRKGDESHALPHMLHAERIGIEYMGDKNRHDHAHKQCSSVADKHARGVAEHIVQEKRDDRTHTDHGQHRHCDVARVMEIDGKNGACHDAIARRKAVDTVYQVNGIDNAHGGKYCKQCADPQGNDLHPPQAVKIIDGMFSDKHQEENGHNLHQKTETGRQSHDVVERTGIEHQRHQGEHNEQAGAVQQWTQAAQTQEYAEEYGRTPQHRYGGALQFAAIGIIHDVFQPCQLHQLRMNPADGQESHHKRND